MNGLDGQRFIQQEFYRFIFEKSMDAILLTSPDGRIHRANPAACKMFQRTEEEIIKAGRSGIVDWKDPRLQEALEERREKGSVFRELTLLRKGVTPFPGQVSSTIFLDDHGREWTAMIIRDNTSLREAEKNLMELQQATEELARRDYLTGVWNRRGFIDKLNQEISRVQRCKGRLSLMMIDIDRFKTINDRYGHLHGDTLLAEFAQRLCKMVRPYDEIGRYGGDEFVLLLPGTGREEAYQVGERIRVGFKEHAPKVINEYIPITVSIGIVEYDCESFQDLNHVLSKLDDNMYRAKGKRDYVYMD